MIQDVVMGLGGTVETEFLGGRPATCTVSIVAADATTLVGPVSATVDPVTTTLSAPSLVGDIAVTLTSVAGITTDGRRYLLDGEDVTVKSITGSVATLWAPLQLAHATGAAFQGVRCSYVIGAGICATEWWDGQAVFTPSPGDPQAETVNCVVRKIPVNLIGLADIREIEPRVAMMMSSSLDIPRSLRLARNKTMLAIGSNVRAQRRLGVDHFRILAAHQWILDRRYECGDQWDAEMKIHEGERDRLLSLITNQAGQGDGIGGVIPGPGGPAFPDINLGAC